MFSLKDKIEAEERKRLEDSKLEEVKARPKKVKKVLGGRKK